MSLKKKGASVYSDVRLIKRGPLQIIQFEFLAENFMHIKLEQHLMHEYFSYLKLFGISYMPTYLRSWWQPLYIFYQDKVK